jgi:hypothetical protein
MLRLPLRRTLAALCLAVLMVVGAGLAFGYVLRTELRATALPITLEGDA